MIRSITYLFLTVAIITSPVLLASLDPMCRSSLGITSFGAPMVSTDNCTVCYCRKNTGLECSFCHHEKDIPSWICRTSVGLFRIGIPFTLPDKCTKCKCIDSTQLQCTGCLKNETMIDVHYNSYLVKALKRRLVHVSKIIVKAFITCGREISKLMHDGFDDLPSG